MPAAKDPLSWMQDVIFLRNALYFPDIHIRYRAAVAATATGALFPDSAQIVPEASQERSPFLVKTA